jgi:phage shock protein A
MATATRRAEERVKMAKKSLGKVMSDRINSEKDLATAQQDLQQWQNSAQVAANQNRPDLVDKYTARQITAQTHVDQLQARFDDLVLRETQMEEALATIRGEYEKLVSLTRQLESRTAVATTKIEAAQLLSEIGKNGSADVLQAIGLVENFESQVSGNIKH